MGMEKGCRVRVRVTGRASSYPDCPHPITRDWGQATRLRKRGPKWLVAQKGLGLGHWLIGCNLTRGQFLKTRVPVTHLH